ncbi:hypothetical protein [Jiella marina]|uniref:hypothetical protein n=1 Tax=Jiella sp. LLJ827 TaxID=2917712 RepID=UPI0021016B36|nr:hypothetical protein [Jiella sp. LLJ827]MCQ0989421.1 hypothetical protein [Jiella sp. LLJ827]
MAVAAISVALSGCVTSGGGVEEVLDVNAPADDAHCRSLLMQPGDLVYAQCRLALRKTYLNAYNTRKAAIQKQHGPVTGAYDVALRADAFCNYDESVKLVQQGLPEEVIVEQAYQACFSTRTALAQEFASATGLPGEVLTNSERATILAQNREALREARQVINGPPGAAVSVTEVPGQQTQPAGVFDATPPAAIGNAGNF